MGSRSRGDGNYRNPCLTMHQPWASLLVYGIKRVEGRSWPSPIRGRLWIHAAGKIPEPATIKAMEDFYREIYAVNGVTDLKFPEHYPISRLLGCVEVVGCVKGEELASWEELPEGVRLEGQTDYCWLCEQPQKLIIPFEMRGYQGVYNLEKKVNPPSASTTPTPVSGGDVEISDQTPLTLAPNTVAPVGINPEFQPPLSAPALIPPQSQFQPNTGPWFPPMPPQPPNNLPNTSPFFNPRPLPLMSQGQFGPSPSHPQPSSTGFSPVAGPPGPAMGPPLGPPRGPQPISQQPIPSGPNAFNNMPPHHMSSFAPNQSGARMQQPMVHPATPNPSSMSPQFSAPSAPQPPPFQSRTPNSFPGNAPNFNPMQSQRPPNDSFTFQPQRPQHLPPQTNPRPMMQNMIPQNQPFRPIMNNPSPQEILEAFLRPLLNQNLNQNRNQFSPLPDSNFGPRGGPRNNHFPAQPNFRGPHMGPRNLDNPFPPRQGNSFHHQQNFPPQNRPPNFPPQNVQHGRGNITRPMRPNVGHGAQQVYDPFSPSAVSNVPPRGGNSGNGGKQEDDPEYEDLMASVGVK